MNNLSSIVEACTYLLAGFYSLYAAYSTVNLGVTAFAATALIVCFCGACYSLFKLLTREVPQ